MTHDLEEAIALADKVVVMTAGPGTVKAIFDIDLPRPRGAVQEIRFEPRFVELHHADLGALRDEVETRVRPHRSQREAAVVTRRPRATAAPVERGSRRPPGTGRARHAARRALASGRAVLAVVVRRLAAVHRR